MEIYSPTLVCAAISLLSSTLLRLLPLIPPHFILAIFALVAVSAYIHLLTKILEQNSRIEGLSAELKATKTGLEERIEEQRKRRIANVQRLHDLGQEKRWEIDDLMGRVETERRRHYNR